MVSQLILVKHSLPKIRPDIPAHQWRLSTLGRRLCYQLADHISPYQPDVICSSPEPKALESAQIISNKLGTPSYCFPALHEHKRYGAPFSNQDIFKTSIKELFKHPQDVVYGEESAHDALRRFSGQIDHLLKLFPEKNLLVVSHGTVISLYVASSNQIDAFDLWGSLGLPSYVVLSLPGGNLEYICESIRDSAS